MNKNIRTILIFILVMALSLPMLFSCVNATNSDNSNVVNNNEPLPKQADGDEEPLYTRDGDNYLTFGMYPQSVLYSNAIEIGSDVQPNEKGYYRATDGNDYAYVKEPQLAYTGYKYDNIGVTISAKTDYYFKVEPIRWRILKEEDGKALIVNDKILFGGLFGTTNDYSQASIVNYINGTFLNAAFTTDELEIIQETNVDNSVATTKYADGNNYVCENTTSRAFLLSYSELTSNSFGFSDNEYLADPARRFTLSDYCKVSNVYMSTDDETYGSGSYWTRSPDITRLDRVTVVQQNGSISSEYVNFASRGVVFAMWIKL